METESTVLQHHAESECRPFFVDLSSLPPSQLDHLKQVGLIVVDSDDENNAGDEDGKLRQEEEEEEQALSVPEIQVLRSKHRSYVEQVWKRPLKAPFVSLDSSRPWMLYWCLHAYDLLQDKQQNNGDRDQGQQQLDTSPNRSKVDSDVNPETKPGAPRGKDAQLLQLTITNTEGNSMVETLRDCFQSYYHCGTKKEPSKESTTRSGKIHGDCGGDGNLSSLYYETHPMDGGGGGDDDDDDGNCEKEETDNDDEGCPDSSTRPLSYYCGGFGGGPGQMAHAATTYAAVLVLCILATDQNHTTDDDNQCEQATATSTSGHYSVKAMELLEFVRIPLYRWIVSLQETSMAGPHAGGFRMHHDGEVDVRATYCVMTVASLLGFIPSSSSSSFSPPMTSDAREHSVTINHQSAVDYVVRCQTYEGGLGGEPWTEAHGGYTFCGVAALQLLGYFRHGTLATSASSSTLSSPRLDIHSLLGWLSRRQHSFEGGFSGRSNKLVDGCYSFWQGGAIAITSAAVAQMADGDTTPLDPWLDSYRQNGSEVRMNDRLDLPFPLLFDVAMLERYILLCAQEVEGGLRDKPSKPRDFYHSCYNLSGLSVAQKCSSVGKSRGDKRMSDGDIDKGYGHPKQTSLTTTHPVYNIRIERVDRMLKKTWCKYDEIE